MWASTQREEAKKTNKTNVEVSRSTSKNHHLCLAWKWFWQKL